MGTCYVPGNALNILCALTHVIFTAPYKLGAIIISILILLMGEMGHREAKVHRANKW